MKPELPTQDAHSESHTRGRRAKLPGFDQVPQLLIALQPLALPGQQEELLDLPPRGPVVLGPSRLREPEQLQEAEV
jgi:hypothetical protein